MAHKSLLTIASDTEGCKSTLEVAIAMARREGAHLDVMCLGVDMTEPWYHYDEVSDRTRIECVNRAHGEASDIKDLVTGILDGQDIGWGCTAGVVQMTGLSRIVTPHARHADLVVLPKPYERGHAKDRQAILEAAMFDGRAPVLVVPGDPGTGDAPRRMAVAWNQEPEALAAIRGALPILKHADSVNIAIVDPAGHGPGEPDPGSALSVMLSRHGVKAEISILARTLPRISDVLIRHVRDLDAEMLVMGAYGHSRFREAIMGGVTREMLEMTEVPVLMAH